MQKFKSYLAIALVIIVSVFTLMSLATIGLAILGAVFVTFIVAAIYRTFTSRKTQNNTFQGVYRTL